MYNNLKKYSEFLLMSKKIINNKENAIINHYSKVINMIIYNIVSLTSILTILLFNSNKVTSNTIIVTKKYLNDMCKINKKIKGGTVLSSEFFGADSGRYTAEAGVDVLKVNFENLEARPALGSTMESNMTGGSDKGGCSKCNKLKGGTLGFNKQLLVVVSKIFKEHKIKIDKSLKQDMVNLIKTYVYFITQKLHKNKKKMTLTIMKSIIKKSGCYKLTI
tara:strand:+ start:5835 stop:6491 length:657 start_codon:yes stop_codon:yes gene_type:complete